MAAAAQSEARQPSPSKPAPRRTVITMLLSAWLPALAYLLASTHRSLHPQIRMGLADGDSAPLPPGLEKQVLRSPLRPQLSPGLSAASASSPFSHAWKRAKSSRGTRARPSRLVRYKDARWQKRLTQHTRCGKAQDNEAGRRLSSAPYRHSRSSTAQKGLKRPTSHGLIARPASGRSRRPCSAPSLAAAACWLGLRRGCHRRRASSPPPAHR